MQNTQYKKRKAKVFELLGGVCIRCGSDEKLRLWHTDPILQQVFGITALQSMTWEEVQERLPGCELYCLKCVTVKRAEADLSGVPHGGGLTGKSNCTCQLCRAKKTEYMANWRKKNAEDRARYMRDWRRDHKEDRVESNAP